MTQRLYWQQTSKIWGLNGFLSIQILRKEAFYLGQVFTNHNTHPFIVLDTQLDAIKLQGTHNTEKKKVASDMISSW